MDMNNMFDAFRLLSSDNYERNEVKRYEKDKLVIDTCGVSDQETPYKFETAISHPMYNNGNWIIVELYKIEAEAIIGHNNWVKKMTQKELPYQLEDVSNIIITKMLDKVSGKGWRRKVNKSDVN